MFIHYAGSLSLCLILALLIFMLIFPSTLVYSLSLVTFVSMFCSFLVFSNSLSGLLGLLILLVYVGAIIIIISYICAISPNIKYYFSMSLLLVLLLIVLSFFFILFLPSVITTFGSSVLSPSFIFTDSGMWVVAIMSLFIILILIYSTYMSPVASSLRASD